MSLTTALRSFAKRHLPEGQRGVLRRALWHVRRAAILLFRRGDLVALATLHGTDKWNAHWYCRHYARHFGALRGRALTLLEIGVGGYKDPAAGGESLRMWKDYFPRATIAGMDIEDKRGLEALRIRVLRGSQADPEFLRAVVRELGALDIVVDDGSHRPADILASFQTLFPLLSADGIYAIEDTQTSYWREFGGREDDLTDPRTTMGWVKTLLDGLNVAELRGSARAVTYTDQHVVAVHAYHNLVFIQKGLNEERSNIPG